MFRRLIRHPRTQAAVAASLGTYLALVARTTRWTLIGAEHVAAAIGEDRPRRPGIIMAFWHERLAIMPLCWQLARRTLPPLRDARAHVLVSQHRDGRLIGDVARRFDLSMVYGSTRRGGGQGLLALARLIRDGAHVVITPDGPRGPRRQAAPGVAHLAALSGRPVLAVGAAIAPSRILGSWDRMRLPLPFGRGVLVAAPPIPVPRDAGESMLPAIAAAMSDACDRADALARERGGVAATVRAGAT
ncbi:MAG: lysophospholipid acyltransferase family protein [Acetobacteraceae bacterium]|nr:lysophospholipid acyltransferase family protein [Acetobacteraceae bacterium]